jgi:uncharacterized protein (TIGR02145 family)
MLYIEHPLTGAVIQVASNNYSDEMTWNEAKKACDEFGDGWRLPSIEEIRTIHNDLYKKGNGNFEAIDFKSYWVGTEYNNEQALSYNFNYSSMHPFAKNKDVSQVVRMVRYLGKYEFNSVKIGDQQWMTKNLDVITFRNGDLIPQASNFEEWAQFSRKGQPAWCYHDFFKENGKKYGKLYNWYAINDPRELAPKGWFLPSYQDWLVFKNYFDQYDNTGNKIKSSSGWLDNNNGTNESGFLAYPCGYISDNFINFKHSGNWWSTTKAKAAEAYQFGIWGSHQSFMSTGLNCGLSVRCIRESLS